MSFPMIALGAALACALLYAAVCLAFWLRQEKLVFYPSPSPQTTPAEIGLAFRDLQIETRDGTRIEAWLIPHEHARAALLVCNGNAGNRANRVGLASFFHGLGLSVMLFDYRGYGGSGGVPSERGVYEDAASAFEALARETGFAQADSLLYGESMGGAVAIEIARTNNLAGLIVEDTFTSLPDVGARLYPWLPVRWLARVRFDSLAKIAAIEKPLLVIHSPGDELVPFEYGRLLFEAASLPKRFLATEGVHNAGGFLLRENWMDEVRSFIDFALAKSSAR